MNQSREGVIIEWSLNGQFYDARDVILALRTDVSEMVDDDNNDDMTFSNAVRDSF